MAFEATPNSTSKQVKWFDPSKEGNARFCEDEFEASNPEAEALVEKLLRDGTSEQVSVVRWHHTQNLPGALPAIRSNCCSLTNYRLVEDEVVEKPVNIF